MTLLRRFWIFYVCAWCADVAAFALRATCLIRGHRWISQGKIDIGREDPVVFDASYCGHCHLRFASRNMPHAPPLRRIRSLHRVRA